MTNVYVLASPAPVLFVIPDALHEGTDPQPGIGRHYSNHVYRQLIARQREEDALLVLGLI